MKTTYSHAAPYIREQVLNHASLRLSAKTQRAQRDHLNQMGGLVTALKILLSSPEGEDQPTGFPKYQGVNKLAVMVEVERYVGGQAEMKRLGFREAS